MPNFQHLLNSRQKKQNYPKVHYIEQLRGQRLEEVISEQLAKPEGTIRERRGLTVGGQTAIVLFIV